MTGPLEGVIGVKKEIIIDRYLNSGKMRFEPEDEGKSQFCGIILEINDQTHKVTRIDRLNVIE